MEGVVTGTWSDKLSRKGHRFCQRVRAHPPMAWQAEYDRTNTPTSPHPWSSVVAKANQKLECKDRHGCSPSRSVSRPSVEWGSRESGCAGANGRYPALWLCGGHGAEVMTVTTLGGRHHSHTHFREKKSGAQRSERI